MNIEIGKKWVEALRSNKYKQCVKGYLYCDGEYCCLGVLCDVLEIPFEPTSLGTRRYGKFGLAGYLPCEAMELSGIDNRIGSFKGTSLISINNKGIPFPEIADIIEQNMEAL